MKIKELQEQYAIEMKQAEDIRLKYDGKAKDMPGDELERWEKAVDVADTIKRQINTLEKQETIEAWAKGANDRLNIVAKETGGVDAERIDAERKAFKKVIKLQNLSEAERLVLKAYQADDFSQGGAIITPQVLANEVITLLKDLVYIRSMATVIPLDRAESLGIPAVDTDPSDADWTTELGTGSEETTLALGKRELKPHPIAKLVKLSKKLLRQASVDAEALWLDRMAYKMAIAEEKAFLTGDGAEKPLGIFTASANGISTNRDVTAANNNAIAADDLISTKYALKAAYRSRASWIVHRDFVSRARKLKDQNNNYVWANGLGPGNGLQGTPDTLLGLPVNESEYAPNTFTTGLYVAVCGDFTHYWIADALDMEVQVLRELYATSNQMGYLTRKETDGMPVLEEAFSRLKLA